MGALVAVGVAAHASSTPFTAGSGYATGRTVALVDAYGGAQLGFNLDDASAEYQDGVATASGAALDSGFTTLLSELQTCGEYAYPPALVPPTTQASTNSTHGRSAVTATNDGALTAPLGHVVVTARPDADGRSDIASGAGGLPGLVTITGGTVHTEAQTAPHAATRRVVADVRDGDVSLLGGLVHLGGLHWTAAVSVDGPDSRNDRPHATPTFEIGSMSLAGAPVPTLSALNRLLAPAGVQIRQPVITRAARETSVGPLVVALGGKTAIGPLLAAAFGGTTLPKIEDALKPGVFDPRTCKELGGLLTPVKAVNAEWNLLGSGYPIIAGAVAATLDGGGELDVDLGGVSATVDDTYYAVPGFGVPQFNAGSSSTPGSVSSTPGEVVTAPGTPILPTPLPPTEKASSTTTKRCDCWTGQAAAAGLGAAAVTAAVFALDEWHRRRKRRNRPDAITV